MVAVTGVLKILWCVVGQCYLMSNRLQDHFAIFVVSLNILTQIYLIIVHGAWILCQISFWRFKKSL